MRIKVHLSRVHELMKTLRKNEGLYSMHKSYLLKVLPLGDPGYLWVELDKREVKLLQREDVSRMFETPLDTGD